MVFVTALEKGAEGDAATFVFFFFCFPVLSTPLLLTELEAEMSDREHGKMRGKGALAANLQEQEKSASHPIPHADSACPAEPRLLYNYRSNSAFIQISLDQSSADSLCNFAPAPEPKPS